ncbi:hypothetical protein HDE_02129 [Halotydeus destructor]|nr:hypothetical protein HDE_02129 [Halotydeus destructor]
MNSRLAAILFCFYFAGTSNLVVNAHGSHEHHDHDSHQHDTESVTASPSEPDSDSKGPAGPTGPRVAHSEPVGNGPAGLGSGPVDVLRCYNCSSHPNHEGAACVDHPERFITDCPNAEGCRKIDQHIDYDMDASDKLTSKHHYVIRSCAILDEHRPCYHRAGAGWRQSICLCKENACNEGSSLTIGLMSAIFTGFLGLLFSSNSLATIS